MLGPMQCHACAQPAMTLKLSWCSHCFARGTLILGRLTPMAPLVKAQLAGSTD